MAVMPMVSVHLFCPIFPLIQVSRFLFLHQASISHPLSHSFSVLSVHSLILSIMHVPAHPGSSWHTYTPCWAVGTISSLEAKLGFPEAGSQLHCGKKRGKGPISPGLDQTGVSSSGVVCPSTGGQKVRGQGHREQEMRTMQIRCKYMQITDLLFLA